MKLFCGVLLLFVNISWTVSFADEFFGEQRTPYEAAYQDDDLFDPRDTGDEPSSSPSMDVLQMLRKRSYPRWYQGFVYKSPSFQTSPLIQSKRFLPFHPLARFRGLSMGGGSGGGGIISSGVPFGHSGYETFVSDSSSIPSPGHPVPSGDTKSSEMAGDRSRPSQAAFGKPRDVAKPKEKINAGDILRMLSNGAPTDRGLGAHNKIFRFGIKK